MIAQDVMDATTTHFWVGPRETQTQPMGILAVDLVDVKRKEMVWHGQATEDSISSTQQGDEKQLQKSLEKMFNRYPPKEK
jgi:hypothetical protein